MSSSVIPSFNEVIVSTLLIHINTLSLLMSHFLRTLLCSLSTTLPFLMSYLYPFFIQSWIPQMHLWLLHLNHYRFILVARVLTPSLWLTHVLWHPPPRCHSCRLPLIFPLPFGKVSSHNPHPIYYFLTYHCLSSSSSAFISTLSSVSIPQTMHEALSHPDWKQGMVEEMAALHSSDTWDLVTLPVGKTPDGCR